MKKLRATVLLLLILAVCSALFAGCKKTINYDPYDSSRQNPLPTPPTEELIYPPFSSEPSGETPFLEEDPIEENNTPTKAEETPVEETAAPQEESTELTTYTAVCATTNVNVRRGASTSKPIVMTLRAGDSLPYKGKSGNWYAVMTEDGVGYLYGAYAYLTDTSAAIENVIRAGLNKLGTPYRWGAPRIIDENGKVSPYFSGKSFDCSSFVQYCYYVGCGIKLGIYTGSQADYTVGEKIYDYAKLKRGDFYFTGDSKISHVVIYLGGGCLLQTYSANGGPVSVTTDSRWKEKFISGRRPDLLVVDQYKKIP